jgi:sterol desaturase/sphingolipid hydroxylase (fatty acid hydroxylase superfamily)
MHELLRSAAFISATLLVLRLVACSWIERRWMAHHFSQRAVFLRDFTSTLFLALAILPLADWAIGMVDVHLPLPAWGHAMPLAVRVPLYFLLADFTHYWVHRLMHLPALWRIHKWHHSPTHMSWIAGNRESLFDALLVRSGYAFFWPLMDPLPGIIGAGVLVFSYLKNDWMHLNVGWRMPWLEWLFVTPRYHHIHHSSDPAHYNSNFGVLFSVWDRLFGTRVDPAVPPGSLRFGIGEQPPLARLTLGV